MSSYNTCYYSNLNTIKYKYYQSENFNNKLNIYKNQIYNLGNKEIDECILPMTGGTPLSKITKVNYIIPYKTGYNLSHPLCNDISTCKKYEQLDGPQLAYKTDCNNYKCIFKNECICKENIETVPNNKPNSNNTCDPTVDCNKSLCKIVTNKFN